MVTFNSIYDEITSVHNLLLAWRKARKGKTKKKDVIEFERDTIGNLFKIHEELKNQTYTPLLLVTFMVRDPKSRKISKSAFRDRIVHHAIVRVIEPIFDKMFIHDSCANRKGKGNLFAIKRFEKFQRKVTKNLHSEGFCLKADIKHYFQEVNQEILLKIIKRKINDKNTIWLIEQILNNYFSEEIGEGMPLGNLTSQFFANVYLHDLDFFVKHKLKAKFYIRYVDDFVILHSSKSQLEIWKKQIEDFLQRRLRLELHLDKSKILSLSKGVDFVGFRIFYYFKLLRKRNIWKMLQITLLFKNKEISEEKFKESLNGWGAYAKWANSHNLKSSFGKVY